MRLHRVLDRITDSRIEGVTQCCGLVLAERVGQQVFHRQVGHLFARHQTVEVLQVGHTGCFLFRWLGLGQLLEPFIGLLNKGLEHAVDRPIDCRTKDHRSQGSLDDVTTFLADTAILVVETTSDCPHGFLNLLQCRGLTTFLIDLIHHVTNRGFVKVTATRLVTPQVIVGLVVGDREETPFVQEFVELPYRSGGTQQQMRQHRAVGDAIDLTHHTDSEAVIAPLGLGRLVLSQGNQGIQRVHLLTASLHTGQDRLLVFLGDLPFRPGVGRRIPGILNCLHGLTDRYHLGIGGIRIGHPVEVGQRFLVALLVGLDPKAFHDSQTEVLHHGFIGAGNFGFPFRTVQQATMQFAGLWIDHVGFNTNTLLLPHIMREEEGLIELQRAGFHQLLEVVTDTLKLTL